MRKLLIFLLPVLLAAAFWAGSALWPDLASKELLRSLGGLFAVVWAILMTTMPKLSELVSIEGLTEAERERLIENIHLARKKIWRIGLSSLACVVALLLLTVVPSAGDDRLTAAFAGLIAGFAFVFLGYAKSWLDEVHAFTVEVNQRRLAIKARDENLKQLGG
jgi:hypothetical protein